LIPFPLLCNVVQGFEELAARQKTKLETDCKLALSTLQKWGSGGGVKKLTLSFATGGGYVEKMKMRMNNAPWHKYVCVDPGKYFKYL
jgi:hypothetical protein